MPMRAINSLLSLITNFLIKSSQELEKLLHAGSTEIINRFILFKVTQDAGICATPPHSFISITKLSP